MQALKHGMGEKRHSQANKKIEEKHSAQSKAKTNLRQQNVEQSLQVPAASLECNHLKRDEKKNVHIFTWAEMAPRHGIEKG